MKYLITPEELKSNGFLNQNIDDQYIITALEEAQDIYLREIIGDNLYNKLLNHTSTEPNIYDELINNHVKYINTILNPMIRKSKFNIFSNIRLHLYFVW